MTKFAVTVVGTAQMMAMVLSGSTIAVSQELYRCEIADAFAIENGKFRKNAVSEFWRNAHNPIIVDTKSGVVRKGELTAQEWVILQRESGESDFVASMHTTTGRANDRFRLRIFEHPPQFIYELNGFVLFSGTCAILR